MQAKIGDRVSLIPSRRAYFFQTLGGISLNIETEPSAIIPSTATKEHLQQINLAIDNGHLSIGEMEKKAEVPDRDSDIRSKLELGRDKIDSWMNDIRNDKGLSRDLKNAILEKVVEFEKIGKNRKSVIRSAESTMRYLGDVSSVTETEQEKIEIKLTSGNGDPTE